MKGWYLVRGQSEDVTCRSGIVAPIDLGIFFRVRVFTWWYFCIFVVFVVF